MELRRLPTAWRVHAQPKAGLFPALNFGEQGQKERFPLADEISTTCAVIRMLVHRWFSTHAENAIFDSQPEPSLSLRSTLDPSRTMHSPLKRLVKAASRARVPSKAK